MHWFSRPAFRRMDSSGKRMVMGSETSLLLNHLIESASTVDVTFQLRSLCAGSIAEFLKWTIKQSSDQYLWEDPAIPEFLLRKIGALANHPLPFKRLAASVIFNKIQRFFRQSEPLVSIFTMELFADFVTSLSLAERDPVALGTIAGCIKSLDHLQLIVTRNKEIFIHPHPRRRVDPYFSKGTLAELVPFLFRHIFRIERHCRRSCMKILPQLAPSSLADSVHLYLQSQDGSIPDDLSTQLDIYRWLLDRDVIALARLHQDPKFTESYFAFIDDCWRQLQDDGHPPAITSTFLLWLEFLQVYLHKSEDGDQVLVGGGTPLIQVLLHAALLPQRLGFLYFHYQLRLDFYNGLTSVLTMISSRASLKPKCQEVVRWIMSLDQFRIDYANWNEDCQVNSSMLIQVLDSILIVCQGGCYPRLGPTGLCRIHRNRCSVPADSQTPVRTDCPTDHHSVRSLDPHSALSRQLDGAIGPSTWLADANGNLKSGFNTSYFIHELEVTPIYGRGIYDYLNVSVFHI